MSAADPAAGKQSSKGSRNLSLWCPYRVGAGKEREGTERAVTPTVNEVRSGKGACALRGYCTGLSSTPNHPLHDFSCACWQKTTTAWLADH